MTQRSWTGQLAWKKWSGALAVSTGDDFQRKVLGLLRLLWPDLQEAPRLKHWDRKGIDLIVWADSGPFPCVVQCKGFEVQHIGERQIDQTLRSIEKFKQSDQTAVIYLIVHNRDGSNREFVVRVEEALAKLVRAGKAKTAMLWDRQRTVKELFWQMEKLLISALYKSSQEIFSIFRKLFRFASTQLSVVPAAEHEMILSRNAAPIIRQRSSVGLANVSELIQMSSGIHWTILTGIFGIGKTTAALLTAIHSNTPVLFLRAASVPYSVFSTGGTSLLTRHVIESLNLLETINDKDKEDFYSAAAAVLSYLLRKKNSNFLFVLDGLDEHRFLVTAVGLQRLSNQIADFSCRVVLTTRQEHLFSMLGDFNIAMEEVSAKYGPRTARIVQLSRWTNIQVEQLVNSAIKEASPDERQRLKIFGDLIRKGEAEQVYGQLCYHPLFLQFILEDVVEFGVRSSGRVSLISSWIARKMRRDRTTLLPGGDTARIAVDNDMDAEEFISRMCRALESVAFEMVDKGDFRLLEMLPGSRVTEIVAGAFEKPVNLLPVLLNSVLIPLSARTGESVPIGFALRIFQEYFLASYLSRCGLKTSPYPPEVQSLAAEMNSSH